jgi:NADPH-dependent curcumin reductase CurA
LQEREFGLPQGHEVLTIEAVDLPEVVSSEMLVEGSIVGVDDDVRERFSSCTVFSNFP